ncbi:hypothetical protein [Caballeronia sp. RCC_10]|uniref:hypothetical protein n=1 Tax=Caballeronia sp. RCC_10 TaxID=3239227 RepID=UPI0035242C6E
MGESGDRLPALENANANAYIPPASATRLQSLDGISPIAEALLKKENRMGAPAYVYTISCVARMLDEPEEWLQELANLNLEPEDGCLGVVNDLSVPADEIIATTAFTGAGIEALRELVADAKLGDS